MIKGVTFLRRAGSAEAYERLSSFFSALGFAHGAGWEDEGHPVDEDSLQGTPVASRGASFLAPQGKLEIVEGEFPPVADILVEVTQVDAVHHAAETWLNANGREGDITSLSAVTETSWKSRIFTAEPHPGFTFSFWAWADPIKSKPVALEGDLSAAGMKFAIVVARWNAVITDRLLEGALDALLRSGANRNEIQLIRVPGAWEIPAAARTLADQGQVDAIITLGCLLRGETAHYEAIYNEVSRGIGQSQQETGIPHSFGVLTCETLEQALNRAGIKAGNKGFEAATAAIEMVSLRRKIVEGSPA